MSDLGRLDDVGLLRLVRLGARTTPVLASGLGLSLLLAVVAGTGRIVTPLTVQHVIDHGLDGSPAHASRVAAVAVLVGGVATVVAGLSSWWLSRRLYGRAESAFASLRRQVLDRVHAAPPDVVDSVPSADLLARVTADVDVMSAFLQAGGVVLLTNVAQMVVAAAVMLWFCWPVAVVLLLVSAGMFVLMQRVQQVIARRFVAVRERTSRLQSVVGEVVAGMPVVRSHGIDDLSRDRVDAAVADLEDAQRRSLWPLHTNTAFGEIAISVLTVVVVVGGTWWTTERLAWLPHLDLSVGRLVALVFLVTFFVRPLQGLVQMLGEAQNAVAGWRRALSVLQVEPGVVTPDAGVDVPAGPMRVQVRELWAAYGDGPPVLRDVDLDIAPGEHVAVVGRTGSGKSTLAKILTRQLRPASGDVLLHDVPIGRATDRSLERRVAIVPQDPFLFDGTIVDNVAVGVPGAKRDDVRRVVDELRLGDWMDALPDGLDTRVGLRGERLSAGERQLVALARTALVDPDLLVLDEATSGVDPATDVRVQAALAVLLHGRTTIAIAHRMVTAETADRIVVMDDGRLVESGPHAELVAAGGVYAALHAVWSRQADDPDFERTLA